MEYRKLGATGIEVSALGFGCGSVGGLFVRGEQLAQRKALEHAFAGGVTYFDTAAAYGNGRSEENLGQALRDLGANPIVGTKVSLEPEQVAEADSVLRGGIEASLKRLGRDRVDVCTLHGWIGGVGKMRAADVCGPIANVMRGFIEAGLCSAIGFTGQGDPAALLEVVRSGAFGYFQCIYSIANPSAARQLGELDVDHDYGGLLEAARETKTGVMGIRALDAGMLSDAPDLHPLSGRRLRESDADKVASQRAGLNARVQPHRRRAEELGIDNLAELAVAFALSNTDVSTVLVGFSDADQVDEALLAAARSPLPLELSASLHDTAG